MLTKDVIKIYASSKRRAKYLAIKNLKLIGKQNIDIIGLEEVKLPIGVGYNVYVTYDR